MNNTTRPLDILRLPLHGERLIEASAGTGKTFTITALYLRLLLGLGKNKAFQHPLGVENLLVVTFTEAAAAELRNRIRANVYDLRIACIRQNTDNLFFKQMLDEITDKQQAAQRLLLAERQMDKAALFTIHGFCQRVLNLNALESGMLYEKQFIEDESKIRYQACVDFWRQYCYPLSRDIAEAVYTQWKNPEELLHTIDHYMQGDMPTIKSPPSINETLASRHEKIISRIVELKKKWCKFAPDIEYVIENSDIDRCKFNRRNQLRWFKKISAWAQEETHSYQLPDVLEKFSQHFLAERTKPSGVIPKHSLFIAIDDLLTEPLMINDLMLVRAMTKIRETVSNEKSRRGELSFDDMLSYLDKALNSEKGEALAAAIRSHFPVAMIDEFQDTDPQQYRIFRRIWYQQPNTALLLIGDPKQAIYSFRGADIFTYMKARREIRTRYTLNTNWRSASGMVTSINTLFTRMDAAFIFREIPFLPVKPVNKNSSLRFEWLGETQPAIRFWLMDGKGCSTGDYQTFMAKQSAAQIRDWISAGVSGDALLWRGKVSRPVKASDITVLVRNCQEAELMRESLTSLGIPSVYLSNHNSVFDTIEAQDTLWLLQAVLSPERDGILRNALASSMFGLTALDIDHLNNDESTWDKVVEEFIDYREYWQKCGIMAMLHKFIAQRQIAENMLVTPDGERRLTNLLHISELLQEVSSQLESAPALVRWLAQHIAETNSKSTNQQIRLESDDNLVQIVTIHKSKGLEYPLVWLPFIANYRTQNQAFYHDRSSFEPILDPSQAKESMKLAETERLAEDLRLLYVALTRAVWHCNMGVAPLFRRQGKKTGKTDFHHSAIGHLIQKGEPKDAAELRLILESLCDEHIALHIPGLPNNSNWKLAKPNSLVLKVKEIRRTIVNDWQVTSYSGLVHGQNSIQDLIPKLDIDDAVSREVTEKSALTLHQFPRGASSGTFLHGLFEDLDFTQPVSASWVLEMLKKNNYEACWQPVLNEWITAILRAPLVNGSVSLSQLPTKDKLVEMEFYLPINGSLQARTLNVLVCKHDPISKNCPPLDFHQISGMIKGFIDLVFRYNGRYYLMDYKSNWLGKNKEAYSNRAMTETICSHRYDLQYQLYTLALHRYLRHRIADYRYETHFGGVIYLFLRGIDMQDTHSGIFITRPTESLIRSMDLLFAKST